MYFISRSLLLKVLGWSLINSLWQMAFLWLIYLVVTGRGNRFSAKAKHNLAFILSTLGTTWFGITMIGNYGNEDLFRDGFTSILLVAGNNFSDVLLGIKRFIDLSLPYLSAVYLGILLLLTLRCIRYYLHVRNTKLAGLHKIKPSLRLFTKTVSTQMGIRRKVAVWLSSIVDSPMTIGFLKPIILIPIATVNHLSTEQVESILLHELTHIKRNDYLVNLFVTVNAIVFFFNPFSRLLIRSIKKEREHSCDDVVMQFQYKPHIYASALLSLEKTKHQHQLAMAAVGRGNHLLLERIKRVTGHAHTVRRYNVSWICFFLLSMMIRFTLMIKPASTPVIAQKIPGVTEVKYWQLTSPSISHPVVANVSTEKKNTNQIFLKNKPERLGDEANIPEDDIRFVNNIESEPNPDNENEDNDDNNMSNAVEITDPAEFSIAPPAIAKSNDVNSASDYHVYVPTSSFSFQFIKDTISDDKSGCVGIVTNKNMQKALITLNDINWINIEKNVFAYGKEIDVNKLQKEIKKSIEQTSVTLSEEVKILINKKDETKIRENLRKQMTTLLNLKITPDAKAFPNNRPVKITLQRAEVRQQLETMRKAQEALKKKVLRIIYI
ncbi:MAG: M56 family metallopeptidase [Bacteroidetes bacterium]|nr:M56 family metallopeptidase [Bacteroidota bacterium]